MQGMMVADYADGVLELFRTSQDEVRLRDDGYRIFAVSEIGREVSFLRI